VLGSPETITLKELGAGRGLFAQDVLDWSEKKFPEFFRALRYVLVEQALRLRERVQNTLSRHFASGKSTFIAPEPSSRIPTIVFANEFFDALPVEVVSTLGSLRIDARDGGFVESWAPPSTAELEYLDRYSVHPEEGERIEVALRAQNEMSAALGFERGFAVVIDYGYTREEQLAGRHRGTLKAIRRHSVGASPYEAPGEQDITADVNFTALASVAEKKGLLPQKVITQSQFLLGIGETNQFSDAFEDCRLPQERVKVALQLKHLVTPAGMGESFHVMVAGKEISAESLSSLAGLSFGRR
jgi:SAM-dependent MidA family methyltransferase